MKTHLKQLPSTLLAAATAVFLVTAAAPPAFADRQDSREAHDSRAPITGTVSLKAGVTSVVFDETFQAALSALGATVQKVIPGQIVKGKQTSRFPIVGGAFDLNTLQAEFIHAGGLTLKAGATTVTLSDFILTLSPPVPDPAIETSAVTDALPPVAAGLPGELSALVTVNGGLAGRVSLLAVDPSAAGLLPPLALAKKKFAVANLALSLTAEGAEALNAAFAVTTFTADQAIGTASLVASIGKRED